ncbi:MAG TPA: methylenetetrahydrofolate reductase [NAD(P)H] [Epulopiscium sp.]|nr:methylenetetrahydrofolate reductase [NAD(P)H] [Candidatus Epulonipiscium sp.]
MKTADIFKHKQVLSFEIFPPKRESPIDTIYDTIDALSHLHPDFISVTYGAGGSLHRSSTLEIASSIQNKHGIQSVAHLPGIHLSKEELIVSLDSLKENGIKNILALRGDINPALPPSKDFKYASDLVSFIHEHSDFNIIGACYPEGHPESSSMLQDIRNLKHKVDAGTDHLITQLFLDNKYFYDFREKISLAGIDVPIEAGIMPVVNRKQIERMVSLCGVQLPQKFIRMMDRYKDNPEAIRDAGIAYAIDQIVDLIAQGVDGIHLYTMNNPYIAQKIYQAVYRLLAA